MRKPRAPGWGGTLVAVSNRELYVGAVLALLALAAWWYSAAPVPAPEIVPASERKPDYVVDDLNGLTMDVSGRPSRRLETPQLRHFPDDGSSELDTPVLVVFDDEALPWRIRAEHGWVSADGDEILLQGAVRIERAAAANLESLVLVTSELLFLPDADYAETDRYAELERGEEWATAKDGMQIWLGEPMRLRLFGRTRMRFGVDEDSQVPAQAPGADRSESSSR